MPSQLCETSLASRVRVPWFTTPRGRHRPRLLLAVAAMAATATALTACGAGSSGAGSNSPGSDCSVTLAVFAPFTGADSVYGPYALDATKLALSQYSAKTLGCSVAIKQFDTQGAANTTVPLATAAAQNANIVAVVGPAFSGETEAAGPIFSSAGLPMISGVASAIDLAQHGWKVFHRTVESDAVDGAGDAYYLAHYLKAPSVALVSNGQAYGAGVEQAAQKKLAAMGVKIPATVTIDPSASDYSAAVLQIKQANAAAVYCGCLGPEAGRLLKQLRSAGVQAQFVGPAGIDISTFLQQAGSAASGAFATAATPSEQASAAIRSLDAQFQKTYHLAAGSGYFVPQWYDAAQAILKAIAAGNHTRAGINNWLSTASFTGASGTVKFDSSGNADGNTESVFKVSNGQFQFVEQITTPS